MKSFIKKYYPIIIIVLFCFGYFYYLFFPEPLFYVTPDFGQSDIVNLHIPIKYLLYNALQSNTLPFWTENIGSGFPLLATLEIGALNPVNVILFKLFPFVIAFNLIYVVSFIINALGTYLFCNKIKISKQVSLFISLIYSFSGYFIVQIPHLDIIQTIIFLPWYFYFTYKIIFDKNKLLSVLLFILVITISIFSTYPQIIFISILGSILFAMYLTFKQISSNEFIPLALFYAALITGIIMSSAQIIPAFEFLNVSNRGLGFSHEQVTQFSFPFSHLFGFFYPFALGNPAQGSYPPFSEFDGSIFWENTGYIGLIPLLFAFSSVFFIKKNKLIPFFLFLLILSLLLMHGKYSPIQFIYHLPGFSLFRVPSRFILLFIWSLLILAAISLDYVRVIIEKRYSKKYALFIIFAIVVISIFDTQRYFYNYNPLLPADKILEKPKTVDYINPSSGRVITMGDSMYWNTFFNNSWKYSNEIPYFNNFLRQNVNSLYGINQSQVYMGNVLQNYFMFNYVIDQNISIEKNHTMKLNAVSEKLLLMENVKYILSPYQITGHDIKVKSLSISPSKPDIKLALLPDSKRAYIVHDKIVASDSMALSFIVSPSFDPRKIVLLEKDDNNKIYSEKSEDTNDSVIITKSSDQEILIDAQSNSPGYLVIADNYYPGWEATINGKKVEILKANFYQKALYIPKGLSQIKLYYYPHSFLLGVYISLITFSIIIASVITLYRKKILTFLNKLFIAKSKK